MLVKSKSKAAAEGPGWEDHASHPGITARGIHLDIVGMEGTGKSSLALTLAEFGSIAYVNIDQSIDRAKQPESKKERERVKRLDVVYAAGLGEEATRSSCVPAWSNTVKRVEEAAATFAAGVVMDTGTELWELNRLAAFGTLTPKGRTDRLYGPVNARQRNLFRLHRRHKKHLVTIHQYKDDYRDKPDGTSVKTGKMVRAGFKEMGYLADIVVECFFKDGEFGARYLVNKLAPYLQETEIDPDSLTFAEIITSSTGTELSAWLKRGKV